MTRDPASARNSMAKRFEDALATIDWVSFGFASKPVVYYEGVGGSDPTDVSEPYYNWAAYHDSDEQASLADENAQRRYELMGTIVMQCAFPILGGQGFAGAERMAIIARNAYRGKQTPDCIWFSEAKIQEVGPDRGFYYFNASAVFHYDEVS